MESIFLGTCTMWFLEAGGLYIQVVLKRVRIFPNNKIFVLVAHTSLQYMIAFGYHCDVAS